MPRPKPRFVASLDQVRITRDGETAVIEYADAGVWTTNLKVGAAIHGMTDQQILDLHNGSVGAEEDLRAQYEHVAVEIPIGRPQLRYEPLSHQWVPRGSVVRAFIEDGAGDEPVIVIDDQELSLGEFGRMLLVHAGWGMRIAFVPDDEVHEPPTIEVRDPADADA